MSQLLPTIIVSLILAGVVALAVRSLWQSHKSGGHCNGDCGTCGGCRGPVSYTHLRAHETDQ